MDLRSVLTVLRRSAHILVIGVVAGALAAFLVSGFLPKVYEANATLLVGQQLTSVDPNVDELIASQQLSTAYAELATLRTVSEAVIANLDLDLTAEELQGQISVEPISDTPLLDIVVEDESPETAVDIANEIAAQLILLAPQLQGQDGELAAFTARQLADTRAEITATDAEIERLQGIDERTPEQDARIDQLQDRLATLRSTYVSLLSFSASDSPNTVTVVDAATLPDRPASPRLAITLVVGALVGLLLALIVIGLREYFRDSISVREDVEALSDLPILATLPVFAPPAKGESDSPLVTSTHPASAGAEAIRTLRTNLGFASVDTGLRSLVVTSATPGDGKTVTAVNLAIAFAQADRQVILVDSDLRHPSIAGLFGSTAKLGLTSALQARSESVEYFLLATDVPNLRVLPSGPIPPNPAELIGSERLRTIVDRLASMADIVIFDSPPLSLVPDGSVLASIVDGTVMVVRVAHTSRTAAAEALETLELSGGHVFGIAINGVESEKAGGGYGFYRPVSNKAVAAPPRIVMSPVKAAETVTLSSAIAERLSVNGADPTPEAVAAEPEADPAKHLASAADLASAAEATSATPASPKPNRARRAQPSADPEPS